MGDGMTPWQQTSLTAWSKVSLTVWCGWAYNVVRLLRVTCADSCCESYRSGHEDEGFEKSMQ